MKRRFSLDTPLVLVVFAVFACCVLSVLLSGAGSYKSVVDRDADVLARRTAEQYLSMKLRSGCRDGALPEVMSMDGAPLEGAGPVLRLSDGAGSDYFTLVYCMDGHVYELYTFEGSGAGVGDGQYVMDAEALSFVRSEGGVSIDVVVNGESRSFYVGWPCGAGGES